MAKTGKQVQGDIYRLLRDSSLYLRISGEVYRYGYRPRDSRKEDATVRFTTGMPDQIQTGVVTVNIFVPDIDPDDNGTWVENGERTEQLEKLAQDWVDSLTAEVSCYRFKLAQTIDTFEEPSIRQHFVCVKLKYEYFGEDDAPLGIPQDGFLTVTLTTEDGRGLTVTPNEKKSNH